LVALELGPLDITFVVILDDSRPLLKRRAMLVRGTHPAVGAQRKSYPKAL
jgi:hypothetical protein